jgi:peptidoglycan/xylan/chitin deacetylase (PgdA/CDA1 family)
MTCPRSCLRWVLLAALVLVVLPAAGVGPIPSAEAATACPSVQAGVNRVAPGSGRTVALSFDDGPGRDTRRIMAILAANHVTATFFNLGVNESRDHAAVRAELAGGYALGDHTWDHRSLPGLNAAGQASEMDRERAVQAGVTGAEPCLFRPPYGSYDATTLSLAQRRGMRVWNWSVDTEDWKASGSGAAYWVNRIVARADAGAGQLHPVILMHNQPSGNAATVAALPRMIAFYRSRGYRFVDLLGRGAAPSVRAISPNSGKTAGGTRVAVTGTGFIGLRAVRFGGGTGTALHVVSATKLYVTSPRHQHGLVSIRVQSTFGTSADRSVDHYSFVRPPTVSGLSPHRGPATGGTRVAVSGTDFRHVTAVRFATVPGRALHLVSWTKLYVTAPAHAAGLIHLQVITSYGISPWRPGDVFTFVAAPAP